LKNQGAVITISSEKDASFVATNAHEFSSLPMIPVVYNIVYTIVKPADVNIKTHKSASGKNFTRKRFTKEEDDKITSLVPRLPENSWKTIALYLPGRTPGQIRHRYENYLCPELKFDEWTPEEDCLLRSKYDEYGSQWVKILKFFPKRSQWSLIRRWYALMSGREDRPRKAARAKAAIERLRKKVKRMEKEEELEKELEAEPEAEPGEEPGEKPGEEPGEEIPDLVNYNLFEFWDITAEGFANSFFGDA
jgi:hypothetical protein